jgi:UDP:flavonoid glycosyltransferase YjiC (YdhE family)
MAKIVYGLAGEGSGHASRARKVLPELLRMGHEVRVATYDRGIKDLQDIAPVFEIEGLSIGTRDNTVSKRQTVADNLPKLLPAPAKIPGPRY